MGEGRGGQMGPDSEDLRLRVWEVILKCAKMGWSDSSDVISVNMYNTDHPPSQNLGHVLQPI